MNTKVINLRMKKKAVQIVKNLVEEKWFFEQLEKKKRILLQQTFVELQQIYNVSGNLIIKHLPEGRSCYCKKNFIISLNKTSLLEFLHEFRHLLQDKKPGICPVGEYELDAELWVGRLLFQVGVKEEVYRKERKI